MAINSSFYGGQNQVQASYAMSYPDKCSAPNPLTANSLISTFSAHSNYRRRKSKNSNRSVNLSNDNVYLRSLVEEKGDNNYQSSFQLAAKLYKSNSDEFKLKKKLSKRSNKKSVLTLPNQPSTLPQSCTVSDMNDTEYLKRINKPKSPKTKKRHTILKKRHQPPNYNYEYYDRDADYCSQMNVYLDCSSVDVVKNFKGDCRRKTRGPNAKNDNETTPSDVWSVLRNINRFQFHPSPPMSDDSNFESMPRKKKIVKKKLNRGVYETCRTEQIAYFSNIEVNVPGDGSPSGSSQITVIDNQNGFDNISAELGKVFHMNTALTNPKIDSAKPTKTKVNRKRIKNSNMCPAKPRLMKNSASKDTLVELKSEFSLQPAETPSNYNDSFVDSWKEKKCTEVEVQTEKDFEQKEEVNKCRMDPQMRAQNARNIRRLRCPLSGKVEAGLQSSARVGPNKSQGQQLTGTSKDVASPAGRPITVAPSTPRASPVNHSLSKTPSKTVAHSTGRPLMSVVPPKTVDNSTDQPVAIAPSSAVPNQTTGRRTLNSPFGRQITTTQCKTVVNPVSLTFSKLQDCPRVPQIPEEPMQLLTQSAIRRMVAKLKFPIVILGRDQVSGTFEVEEYDYPQFRGLDKQVWPFMINWIGKPDKSFQVKTGIHSPNQNLKDKPITISELNPSKCNKKERTRKTSAESKVSAVNKFKPTPRFRDNMLEVLYKKASHQNVVNDTSLTRVQRDMKAKNPPQTRSANTNTRNLKSTDVVTNDVSIAPSVVNPEPKTLNQRLPSSPLPPSSTSKIQIPTKYGEKKINWGKTKWASDYIENVFKNIRNGTYYTSEIQYNKTKPSLQNRTSDTDDLKEVNDSKEVSIQVSIPLVSEDFTPKITIQKKKELSITLPGFDEVLPQLEIKSMTRNQIAVKNCITNVLLQFDVNILPEADRTLAFKRSTSCVPVSVTERKAKVFKCKTRILNAALPAELCSIIPKVMMQFLDREAPLALTLQEEKRNTSLSTISENMIFDIQGPAKLPLLPQIEMFPELRSLRNGRFSKSPKLTEKCSSNENFYIVSVNELPYEDGSTEGPMLLRASINQIDHFVAQPRQTIVNRNSTKPNPTITSVLPIQDSLPVTNLCTALVPYTGNKMMFGDCITKTQNAPILAFKEFFRMMLTANTNCMSEYFPTIQIRTCSNRVYTNCNITNHQGMSNTLCINDINVNLEPLYNPNTSHPYRAIENNGCTEKQIQCIKPARTKELNSSETNTFLTDTRICKSRKKGHVKYVKLYKKCKSTSHITAERNSTLLSKVTNLDEFFHALGAGKTLSSAFDGSCGSKILSCISDLKNYITGITPRQAMLVLLLANKKHTSNLLRFRPVILQGIAVSRITRVSELDMEVEVIERERFKMPEYLDTPPLLETTQNNDNLLEELCWIAKTTASDYKRRFDESSEKLLKALLEKRKRLNPSYLRVMARYVGLGLLKTPANH